MNPECHDDLPLLAWRPFATVHPFPPARWCGFIRREAKRIADLPADRIEREVARATGEVGLRLVGLHCNQFLVGRQLDDFEDALKLAIMSIWENEESGGHAA